jgi:membrane protein
MYSIYVKQRVTRSSAALAYFLMTTIFPSLICASSLLGSLNITGSDIAVLKEIIPAQALSVIGDFLEYISRNQSAPMFAFGVITMLTSSAAAFRTIINIMGDIQGEKRYKGILGELFNFALSLGFLAIIYISGLVIVSGEWLLNIIGANFVFGRILSLWKRVRFAMLFILLFAVIYVIYLVSAPKNTKKTRRLPGALIATVLLVVVSMVFSRLISASVKYALVYGSLASVIILMTWLYTCGIVLIMGNVLNICVAREFHKE